MKKEFTKEQLIEQVSDLDEIRQELQGICAWLDRIISERNDENARRDILAPLEIVTSREHMWISYDSNLEDLIEKIRDEINDLDERAQDGGDPEEGMHEDDVDEWARINTAA